jgi:hypothetical protein
MKSLDQFITDLSLVAEGTIHLSQDQIKKLQSIKTKVTEIVKKVESYPKTSQPTLEPAPNFIAERKVFSFSDYEILTEKILKRGSKWVVTDKSGKNVLGTHPSKEKALKQLRAIEISKMGR